MFRLLITFAAAAMLLGAFDSAAGDWTHWRGPNRNGVTSESIGWSNGDPAEVWRVPLGEGFSSVSIADGRAYTMFASGDDEYAVCLEAATGDELWRRRVDETYPDHQGGNGPRATPAVDGDMVFVQSGYGKVYGLKTSDGEPVWSSDLRADFGGRIPQWGYSASPLAHNGRVYVQAGGGRNKAFVAFDKRTGDVAWTAHTDAASYATPVPMTIAGVDQIVFYAGSGPVGVSPEGETLWRYQWANRLKVQCAAPLLVGSDKLLVTAGYDKGAAYFQVTRGLMGYRAEKIWEDRVLKSRMASPILREGYVYGFDGGTLKCIETESGEERWTKRGFGEGTLIMAGGDLVVLGDNGDLAIVAATPEGYVERARTDVFDTSKVWAPPTLANGMLYLRDKQEIVCLDMGG